ncbi:hypothetical protein Fleli_0940 [Bernardetia litoralis DSM 6794]|uniref:Uncharacterized protein n=1 Tax=Bernardetia litoralis (strain ATCC 23117 / DSM 6794 / NBRC 15988 / NCIMB 1366 / Fx l1 / Sio-4) TaxID=880071 RepID=I4AHF9_BERLS|nr:hypothetical protein [Bernardetia litoralis]AFM03394.1 hypothetical protein Fleli_0940 [Bernardetia litoralis DSM 6794]
MSSKMALIAFILVMSVLFPAAGYFMDYMRYRKYRTLDKDDVRNDPNYGKTDLELEKK